MQLTRTPLNHRPADRNVRRSAVRLSLAVWLALALPAFAGKIKFTYDGAGRLVTADYGSNTLTTFIYDPNGNLLQRATAMPTNADVRLTKVASVTAASAGLPFNYTLVVSNAGPDTATDVVVTDPLPFGILLNSLGSPSQGTAILSNRTVVGSLGALPAGQSATLVLSVFHGITNAATNIAMVTASTADPDPNNNLAMDDTRGLAPSDSDNDGMPNWWETLHGLSFVSSSGVNGANGHRDADGVRNFDEWVADTDPSDSNSFFRVGSILYQPGSPGTVSVSFDSSPIRQYQGEVSDTLNPPAFVPFATNNGTGLPMQLTYTNASDSNQFLRVQVRVP